MKFIFSIIIHFTFLLCTLLPIQSFSEELLPPSSTLTEEEASLSSNYFSQYHSPTQRFIKGHSQAELNRILSIGREHLNFFEEIISKEKKGFFGYHSAPQSVRIYQDFIKIGIEEILKIKIKDDFYFLRIPGDERLNYKSSYQFLSEYLNYQEHVQEVAKKIQLHQSKSFNSHSNTNNTSNRPTPTLKANLKPTPKNLSFPESLQLVKKAYSIFSPQKKSSIFKKSSLKTDSNTNIKHKSQKNTDNAFLLIKQYEPDLYSEILGINDMTEEIQLKILSLNMALYQTEWGSPLTLMAFCDNHSFSSIYLTLERELQPFFTELGISPSYIKEGFTIAQENLSVSNGVILQFYEESTKLPEEFPYSEINTHGYASYPFGMPLSDITPSHYLLDPERSDFPELKLMMSNHYSLNPYSSIIIKRHDNMSNESREHYETKIREFFQSLPINEEKAEIYREKLLHIWNTNISNKP